MVDALSLKDEFLTLLEKDKEFRYAVAGLLGLEEILRRLDRNEQELVRLREDMNRGFMLVERHISALGARWGLMAEETFRQSIRGLVEKEFGFKVERWTKLDREGVVFGYPSQVDIDANVYENLANLPPFQTG